MWRDERGLALVVVLLCAVLFLALAGALVVVVGTEATISATFREGAAALAGAEAAATRVFADVAALPELDAALAGAAVSTFVDGPPGPRTLPDGTTLDLGEATNMERCGAVTCTDAELDAVTSDRPWGVNNPRWQLFGAGWLRDLAAPPLDAPRVYAVVWIADDPLETDGNPRADAPEIDAPGHDTVLLRAAAYAAYGTVRRIEVMARRDGGRVRVLSWREVR